MRIIYLNYSVPTEKQISIIVPVYTVNNFTVSIVITFVIQPAYKISSYQLLPIRGYLFYKTPYLLI